MMEATTDALIIKYAFTYGPLMIFFFAVGYGIYRAAPVAVSLFKEMVAAMNSSTIALNNSTQALNSNSDAMHRHYETVATLSDLFKDMRERIDAFECPHSPPTRRRPVAIKSRSEAA